MSDEEAWHGAYMLASSEYLRLWILGDGRYVTIDAKKQTAQYITEETALAILDMCAEGEDVVKWWRDVQLAPQTVH